MQPTPRVDRSAAVMAAVLAAIAAAALWQSREFSPFAAIFPRAVGSALLLCSLLSLWRTLRGRAAPAESIDRGGAMRSAMLVLVLLLWVAMLDTAGFALASWVGFFVLTLLANRDPPSPRARGGLRRRRAGLRAAAATAFPARPRRAPAGGRAVAQALRLTRFSLISRAARGKPSPIKSYR